jgi:cellulose synthase operon protein C
MTMLQTIGKAINNMKLGFVILVALQASNCSSPDDRARGYFQQGMTLLAAHDSERAAVQFRNAVRIKRDLVEAWKGLAQIAESKQRWSDLIATLKVILEIEPDNINERVRLAKVLLLGGSVDEALSLTNRAYELNSQDVNVLTLKAAILFKLADHEGAVREATAALAIDSTSAEAAMVLAAERMARGDAKGALQILDSERVVQAEELGVELLKLSIFEQAKDLPEMAALLRKLAKQYPERVAFRRQLIKTYLDQGLKGEAEQELRSVVAASPDDVEPELDLVRFLYAVKGPDAAKQELTSQIDSGRNIFSFQMAMADLELAQGNTAGAITSVESLINGTTRENAILAQMKLAQIFVDQKRFKDAESVISNVIGKDRRNIAALKLRAFIRMEHGLLDAAVADLREAIHDQPQSADLLLQLATTYERNGTIELAEKQFADATRASGFNPNVGLAYVAFLRRRGSAQRAEDVLVELSSRWPKNIEVLSALADAKLSRRDWVGAQEVGETIRRLGNDKGVGDQILGAALIGRNKYNESIDVLQNAYEAAPSAVQPMFALVRAFVRAQKPDKAINFLQSVLQANPTSAEAYALLGAVQFASNSTDQALKSFLTAIEKQPKNVIGYRAMAEFQLSQKNSGEALKFIEVGLREIPGDASLRLLKASIMETQADYEGAIAEYQHMLEDQPDSLIVANNLASVLADHRTDKESLQQAKSLAIRLRKSPVPQFKDTVGWTSYQQGDLKGALAALEEAVVDLPNLAVIRYHLGMSYLASGQTAKATEQFKHALSHAPDDSLKEKIQSALERSGT